MLQVHPADSSACHSEAWLRKELTFTAGPALQLRRLSLRGDGTDESKREPRYWHQLSTLTTLEALQVRSHFRCPSTC